MKKNNLSTSLDIHKVNNLLTNIGLSAELLLTQLHGPLTPKQKTYAKTILSEVKKIKKILQAPKQ